MQLKLLPKIAPRNQQEPKLSGRKAGSVNTSSHVCFVSILDQKVVNDD